jgi:hypothetical protein
MWCVCVCTCEAPIRFELARVQQGAEVRLTRPWQCVRACVDAWPRTSRRKEKQQKQQKEKQREKEKNKKKGKGTEKEKEKEEKGKKRGKEKDKESVSYREQPIVVGMVGWINTCWRERKEQGKK